MKIICISGHAQNGKDTVAQIMQKTLWGYGERVLIAHYADLVKYICKQFFDWDGKKDEYGRSLLQYVGTNKVRAKEPDFWVGFICKMLELFPDEWDYVLIPDCRFPNELDYLRNHGFDVVHLRVRRDGFDNGLTETQKAHPSETSLDHVKPDAVIHNTGSLADLTGSVLQFIRPIQDSLEKEVSHWKHEK